MNADDADSELVWSAAPKKRGRKPLGQKAMSAAEQKRRSRERDRAKGAREFLVKVGGFHLKRVEDLAKAEQIPTASALRQILEMALDRYAAVMLHCERMSENGATEEMVHQFFSAHFYPPIPPIQERKVSPKKT
jgi:imidazolonepropionase-like amidohydrolase